MKAPLVLAALAALAFPARAQLGGQSSLGSPGLQQQSDSGGMVSAGGIDMEAIRAGDLSSVERSAAGIINGGAGECGGDGIANMARSGAAAALASTFSGGGYPTMDIGSILRLMAQLKEAQDQTDIQCGIRRDHSVLTNLVDRANSGWRSVIPDGVSIDGVLNGTATGGVLSSWVDRMMRRDRVYEGPDDLGFDHQEMLRRGRSISGAMGAQQALLDQISEREQAAAELEAAHRGARTAAAKQDAANRYREEQNKIGILRGQLSAVNARAQMEQQNSEHRLQENRRQELDIYMAKLVAARAARFALQ